MTREEYTNLFREHLTKQFPEASVEPVTTEKFDGVRDGLAIRLPDTQISPVLYPDRYYHLTGEGKAVDEIVAQVSRSIRESLSAMDLHAGVSELCNPENLRLVPLPRGTQAEVLDHIPNFQVPGTDIHCGIRQMIHADGMSERSYLVRDEHLPGFQLTKEEILEKALQNTRQNTSFVVESLAERFRAMGFPVDEGMDHPQGTMTLYVITTASGDTTRYGAAAIALPEVLERAAEKMGSRKGIFLIPSSTEELLALDRGVLDYMTVEDLRSMVHEVNATEVSEDIQLSENVFFYDGELQIATPELEESLQTAQSLGESVSELMSETADIAMDETEKMGRSR